MAKSGALSMLALSAGALAGTIMLDSAATPSSVLHALAATQTELSGDINFSAIDKPIAVPDVPNCSTSGTLSLVAGGFDDNDSDLQIAMDFFHNGFLRFQANKMAANVSLDLGLLSGAQNTDFKVPLFSKDLLTLSLGPLASIDVGFQINVPVKALLDSEADIFAGFLLSVPDGSSIQLDVGNPSASFLSGFDEMTLTPLMLDANLPNLNLSASTGLEFVLTANSSGGGALAGNVAATLHLPTIHTDAKPLTDVDANCAQVQGGSAPFQNAVNVVWDAQMDLDVAGEMSVDIAGFTDSWAPNFQVLDFSFPLPTQCLKWDPLESGLVAVTQTIGTPTAAMTTLASATATPSSVALATDSMATSAAASTTAPTTSSATTLGAATTSNEAVAAGPDVGCKILMGLLATLVSFLVHF